MNEGFAERPSGANEDRLNAGNGDFVAGSAGAGVPIVEGVVPEADRAPVPADAWTVEPRTFEQVKGVPFEDPEAVAGQTPPSETYGPTQSDEQHAA